MTDKDKVEKLKPLKEKKYENVDLDHLIIYAMGELEKIDVDLSFENAVIAAFKLFPKKFSLLGYPSYPDSLRVYTCLWRCSTDKKKLWLGGKIRQGFIITDRSRKILKEAEKLLDGLSPRKIKASSQTRRKEFLMVEVKSSSAYSKYKKGEFNSISESDFCFLLQGTLDTPKEILIENFKTLKMFSEELERYDILKFLDYLEKLFKEFLELKK